MLRFDLPPVSPAAYRAQAAMTFAIAAAYLFTPYRWLAAVLAFAGLLRGFVSPQSCPSYRLLAWAGDRLGYGKRVNAGAKLFADKIVGIAGLAMFAAWLLDSELGVIPATALLVFSALDVVTGFCIACWAYTFCHRVRAA